MVLCDQRLTASKVISEEIAGVAKAQFNRDQRLTASKVISAFKPKLLCNFCICDQRLTASKVISGSGIGAFNRVTDVINA